MAHFRVYRTRGGKYNPQWLKVIRKTKVGADRSDWIEFIYAWRAGAEKDDWDPWCNLLRSWNRPRRFRAKELKQLHRKWKLPFSPTIGTGQGLARSNRRIFDKIKAALRNRGEGKACWACGTAPSRTMRLNAHEFWDFDYKRRVRRLTAVRFLCIDCHYLTHCANVMFLPLPDENVIRLTELYCRVNDSDLIEAYSYLTFFAKDNHGDFGSWSIDLSMLDAIVASPYDK